MNTKWHEETRADAERVISSDPANAMAWHSLGNALSALDQPGEADACYERALALAPDSAQMWKRGLDTRSAMTELKVRAAEADLERRLTLNPRDVDAVAVHAGALALLMRFEEASQARPTRSRSRCVARRRRRPAIAPSASTRITSSPRGWASIPGFMGATGAGAAMTGVGPPRELEPAGRSSRHLTIEACVNPRA